MLSLLGNVVINFNTSHVSILYESNDTLIDGGNDTADGTADTKTDTLVIDTSDALDLSNVAVIATNIEVIDASVGTVINNISVDDVISLTDDSNDLVIQTDDLANITVDSTLVENTANTTATHVEYYESGDASMTTMLTIDDIITQ
jgi:hypothetical protein